MNADLELARAVFPRSEWNWDLDDEKAWRYYSGLCQDFDPLCDHFADVLAWLLRTNWPALKAALVKSDGTAASLKQAVYEAAIRVIKEGKV